MANNLSTLQKVKLQIHANFKKNEAKLHELNYLFWECTQRCNLNCIHCGSDCSQSSEYQDMPFQDFLNAIIPLRAYYKKNSILVVITGGEPLVRKDLAACGHQLRKHGFRWGIVTNGLLYSEKKQNELLNAGMGSITLSLDGFEDSHNWMRGNPQSFKKAKNALHIIKSSPRLNYDVVTCVNQRNIFELYDLKELLIKEKIRAWRLFTISPIGRAKENSELHLNAKQLKYLMNFIEDNRKEDKIDIKFSCEGYVGKYEKKVRDSYFFCRAGINIASVLIDGSISACPNIDRGFVQGNIYSDNFLDVWNDKFTAMRDRKWTKTGKCASCKDYKYCEGSGLHLWDKEKNKLLVCHNEMINCS